MSGLRLALAGAPPAMRLDLSGVVPDRLVGLAVRDIALLPLGTGPNAPRLGDVFTIEGAPGDTLVIAPGAARLDHVGAGMRAGAIILEGDAGDYAARTMHGGRLDIRGSAGDGLAASMKGGFVSVIGSAGSEAGAPAPAQRDGLKGGIVLVGGDIGPRCGMRMRSGTIIANGRIGEAAGARMMGGTIRTLKGFGPGPGALLKRGTLIAPSAERMLPTYVDCGRHRLLILALTDRYLAASLGAAAPPPLTAPVRRFMGDTSTIGRGELLLTDGA
ncbi:MAG: formylmethanofuran dehydrogenase subunit C [Hyphomicrobiaceae bacterium]|nr:formylmethanofuran dehydrogenase subunit C [Hyphomicrobiaceae bacterium]